MGTICHWTAKSSRRAFLQLEARRDGNSHSAAGAQMLNLLQLFFSDIEKCLLRHVYGPASGLFSRRFHVLERNVYLFIAGDYSLCLVLACRLCFRGAGAGGVHRVSLPKCQKDVVGAPESKVLYLWVAVTVEALSLHTARFTATFWKAVEEKERLPAQDSRGTQAIPSLLTQYLTGDKWLNCTQIPQP